MWLTGDGALLGPIAGIRVADYWIVRRTRLDVDALYQADGPYRYAGVWNPRALIAFAVPVLVCLPGFLQVSGFATVPGFWAQIYEFVRFIGVIGGLVIYTLLMRGRAAEPA